MGGYRNDNIYRPDTMTLNWYQGNCCILYQLRGDAHQYRRIHHVQEHNPESW